MTSQQIFFHASNMTSPRYVWAPEVHNYYNETCHFALITPRVFTPGIERRIKDAVNKSGVPCASIYVLYGRHDYLIRYWATRGQDNWFKDFVERAVGEGEVSYFKADHVAYQWAAESSKSHNETPSPESNLSTHLEAIQDLCDSLDKGDKPTSQTLEPLLDAGLIYHINDERKFTTETIKTISNEPQNYYKVFIWISRQNHTKLDDSERTSIITEAERMQESTHANNVSVYIGNSSFAQCMIKAVFDNYTQIRSSVDQVRLSLNKSGFRTETHLCAGVIGEECDHTDAQKLRTGTECTGIAKLIGDPHDMLIPRTDSSVREELVSIYNRSQKACRGNRFDKMIRSLLLARLLKNGDHLEEATDVTREVDFAFCHWCSSLIRKYYPNKNFDHVKNAWNIILDGKGIGKKARQRKLDLDHMNLGDMIPLVGKLADVREKVDATLDMKWIPKLERMRKIRNHSSHGEFRKVKYGIAMEVDYLETEWQNLAITLIEVAPLLLRIEREIIDSPDNHK